MNEENKDLTENIDNSLVNPETGLTSEQIEERINNGEVNHIAKHVTKSYWKIVFDNIFNFFNILLFVIAALMIVAQIEITAFAFLVILIANIAIGLIQDIRARRLVDRLRVVSYPIVQVLRNGQQQSIPANEVVLHDLIILQQGAQIVCDGTVIQGNVEVNESMLTGESTNIHKPEGSLILSGSYVNAGKCLYRVDKLGSDSYAEKLQAKAKEFRRAKSEILHALNNTFRFLGVIVVIIGICLFVTIISKGNLVYPSGKMEGSEFQQTVRAISGSMVSMLPTGMYLLTSMTLAIGVIRLARKRMLVQEMYCIEMLARADVLCLDKTGTITDGSMVVKELIKLNDTSEQEIGMMLHTLINATEDNNATANAILLEYGDYETIKYSSSIPFSSERKYSAVTLSTNRSIVVGAKEFLNCTDEKINQKCFEYEQEGYRVLLIGTTEQEIDIEKKLPPLHFLGILVLEDHIKEDAYENIKWFRDNGVSIRVISGDSPISVSQIAKRVGVEDAEKFISLDGLSLDEVRVIANKYTVFGRVSPEQKQVLIESIQEAGHTVAMTGDGVNDVLALKVADCSISMASGSDATKNVSQIVALDSNFSSLPRVVAEGRRVINNLQRTCTLFLTKTFFAIVMTLIFWISGLTLIQETSFLKYPFITNTMYIWELFTIGIGSFFLSIQPNESRLKHTFARNILTKTLPAGMVQVLVTCVFFIINMANPQALTGIAGQDGYQTAITLAVLAFSIGSLIIFIRTCFPLDFYRGLLAGIISFLAVGAVLLDKFIFYDNSKGTTKLSIFKLDYNLINNHNWWILMVVCVGAIGLYAGLEFLAKFIDKKVSDKHVFKEGE